MHPLLTKHTDSACTGISRNASSTMLATQRVVAPTPAINAELSFLEPQWSSDYALVPEQTYQPNNETRFLHSHQTAFAASQNQISRNTKLVPLQPQSQSMPLRQPHKTSVPPPRPASTFWNHFQRNPFCI